MCGFGRRPFGALVDGGQWAIGHEFVMAEPQALTQFARRLA
jgi:hypothetical protein